MRALSPLFAVIALSTQLFATDAGVAERLTDRQKAQELAQRNCKPNMKGNIAIDQDADGVYRIACDIYKQPVTKLSELEVCGFINERIEGTKKDIAYYKEHKMDKDSIARLETDIKTYTEAHRRYCFF